MDIFLKEREERDYFAPQQGGVTNVYLKEGSHLRFYTFNFGAGSVKNELNVIFQGKGAKAELYGLYLPSEDEVIENNTFLHHKAAFCQSSQYYYGILFGRGKAFFQGRILVPRYAQKTDAFLESRNILLSKEAQMLGRPFLEIFADDIKCTHAFSSSQLEDDEIFYLRSRGIGKKEAKKILLLGFAQRIISKIGELKTRENLCAKISQFLTEKLEAGN